MPTQEEGKRVFQSVSAGRMILLVVLFVTVLGVLVYAGTLFLGRQLVQRQQSQDVVSNEYFRQDLELQLPLVRFRELKTADITPEDSTLYLVSSDFPKFSSVLASQVDLSELVSIITPFIEESEDLVSDSFSILQRENDIALVFKIENREEVSTVVDQLQLPDTWGSFFVGDYLLFSNSESYIEDIDKSFKKRSLPMGLSAPFQKVVSELPEEGQVFIYLPFRSKKVRVPTLESESFNFIPEQLSGDGFVLITEGGGAKIIGGSR